MDSDVAGQTSAAQTTAETTSPSPTPSPSATVQPTPTPAVDPDVLGDDAKEQLAMLANGTLIESLYNQIAPSVVGIQVEVQSSDSATPLTDSGSGVIYRTSGLILTSADLLSIALDRYGELQDSTKILVRIDGLAEPFEAQLIGKDKLTGVAVLSIAPGKFELQPAVFTIGNQLKIGQHVFACSFPDELIEAGSMTSGIINALHQPIQLEDGTTVEMIRSDAPIMANGNGGPLINLAGEVVALSSSSELTDTYDSLSFAMPAETVISVADSLILKGFVSGRVWLGVAVLKDESFDELQALYRFPDGLYVSHVIQDSPAYIADIRRGDIITAIDGQAVDKHQSLSSLLSQHKVGDQIELTVYRRSDDATHDIKVYLKEYQ
ncbi:MAG: serine protease [Firmicutes bacterium]|nr:serine protease [Bacillota bacterium]